MRHSLTRTDVTSPYEAIGGEQGVRQLVTRFYALMDELPSAAACRAIHPPTLTDSAQKLFEYLSGWLGGPQLFVERRGPPMLRARHLHVPVGPDEIAGWLDCFRAAWAETVQDEALTQLILPKVEALALHMHNQG
jgi:hemoglobin